MVQESPEKEKDGNQEDTMSTKNDSLDRDLANTIDEDKKAEDK